MRPTSLRQKHTHLIKYMYTHLPWLGGAEDEAGSENPQRTNPQRGSFLYGSACVKAYVTRSDAARAWRTAARATTALPKDLSFGKWFTLSLVASGECALLWAPSIYALGRHRRGLLVNLLSRGQCFCFMTSHSSCTSLQGGDSSKTYFSMTLTQL